jgi:hypothetical protein
MTRGDEDDLFGEALCDLGRCIRAFGDHRKRIVLTGGMVPLFYRQLPGALPVYQKLLTTFDLDWTVPRRLPVHRTPQSLLNLGGRTAPRVLFRRASGARKRSSQDSSARSLCRRPPTENIDCATTANKVSSPSPKLKIA